MPPTPEKGGSTAYKISRTPKKGISFFQGLRVLGSWSWGLGVCFRHFRTENGRFGVWEGFQRLRIAISIHTVVFMSRNLRSGPVLGPFVVICRTDCL